jgi:ATP-dependent DNA helicase HFM1/MER3
VSKPARSKSQPGSKTEDGRVTTSARTKQRNVDVLLFGQVLTRRRCKHFCCRDGLEKPPKPSRKRSCTGNKASSTSQLTLSASITKKDAADAPDKHKESVGSALTQPVLRRNENSDSKTAGKHRAGRSILSEARPMAQKTTSSDYGDDSLDDLPSPSALLRESGTSFTEFPSTNDKKEPEGGTEDSIFDDLWDIVETPSAETRVQHERVENATKPTELLQENTRPESPVSSNCVPGIESTPISSLFPGDAGPILANTADFDDSRGQKRKDCPVEEDTENDGKRLKPCTPNTPLEERSTILSELAAPKQDLAGVQAETSSGQQDWGDIDPVLLDEFKDIVNFF